MTFFGPLLASGAAEGGSNYGDYKDPALDAEVKAINEMPPGAERRQAWAELSTKTATELAPWLTFVTRNNLNLVSDNYGGYYYGSGKSLYLALGYVNQ